MMLSRHFALEEFTRSTAAKLHKIDNTPPAHILSILSNTAAQMEIVRELLGRHPITVTSGYRDPKLNKIIGGSTSSQHMTGQAVDFVCPAFGTPADIVSKIKHSVEVNYDQLICEHYKPSVKDSGWVHISFAAQPRRQALWIDETGARAFA